VGAVGSNTNLCSVDITSNIDHCNVTFDRCGKIKERNDTN